MVQKWVRAKKRRHREYYQEHHQTQNTYIDQQMARKSDNYVPRDSENIQKFRENPEIIPKQSRVRINLDTPDQSIRSYRPEIKIN